MLINDPLCQGRPGFDMAPLELWSDVDARQGGVQPHGKLRNNTLAFAPTLRLSQLRNSSKYPRPSRFSKSLASIEKNADTRRLHRGPSRGIAPCTHARTTCTCSWEGNGRRGSALFGLRHQACPLGQMPRQAWGVLIEPSSSTKRSRKTGPHSDAVAALASRLLSFGSPHSGAVDTLPTSTECDAVWMRSEAPVCCDALAQTTFGAMEPIQQYERRQKAMSALARL